ncbi:hypothetical protein GCM10025784_17700 [Citricoccus nitrophenolicus]
MVRGLLDRGAAEAPDMIDPFRRNQLVFRAEIRIALEITNVKELRVVERMAPVGA